MHAFTVSGFYSYGSFSSLTNIAIIFQCCCEFLSVLFSIMADIDTEQLITLVQERPVLWDKFLDVYKDRVATKNAWREVLLQLNPDFDSLDDKEKNSFGKEVIKRWANLRDSFTKSKKKEKDTKRSGAAAKRQKKYIYSDQMGFLQKLYEARESMDSLQPDSQEPELDEEEDIEPQQLSTSDSQHLCAKVDEKVAKKISTNGRKRRPPDDVELRILQAIESEKPCSKMAFLQSLMPHLQKFNEQDYLQFQLGVLNVIENINEKKKAIFVHTTPQFSHPAPPYQQFSNHSQSFVHPPTSAQYNSPNFFNNQSPFYYPQGNVSGQNPSSTTHIPISTQSPSFVPQPGVSGNQHQLTHSQHIQSHNNQIADSKDPPTASRYFHEFGPSTSIEIEQISPSVNSVESSMADSIDFGTSN